LIVDQYAEDKGGLEPLYNLLGHESGKVNNLFTRVTDEYPTSQQVTWAEAVKITINFINGELWLTLEPDIWIWPPSSRQDAVTFLKNRKSDRNNQRYNELLTAWVKVILDTEELATAVTLSAFNEGTETENPVFKIGSRTAFSRKV
jgi:hypothetical protein